MISRRALLAILGSAAGVAAIVRFRPGRPAPAGGACAAIAGRRIRWIVPHSVGGGYDAESRLLAPFLARRLGAEILIDNVAGGGGLAGARVIAAAAPDGLTLGIVGVSGLVASAMAGAPDIPDPIADFTVLGRLSRSWHVWAAGARANGITSLDAALTARRPRPLVFAVSEVGSANFVSITATAAALGVDVDLVAGFAGNRDACLAAIRGDVDLVCFNFDTIRDLIEAGDLRPILQVSRPPGSTHPSLAGVPVLGGPDGVAARRARGWRPGASAPGETPEWRPGALAPGETPGWRPGALAPGETLALADAVVDFIATGRVICAPPGLPAGVADCLSRALYETLVSDELNAAARHELDVADAVTARADIRAAAADAALLRPAIEAAMRKVRRGP